MHVHLCDKYVVYIYTYTYTSSHTHTVKQHSIHRDRHKRAHTQTHTHKHTHTHTNTHTQTHRHTHTLSLCHTYTHVCVCVFIIYLYVHAHDLCLLGATCLGAKYYRLCPRTLNRSFQSRDRKLQNSGSLRIQRVLHERLGSLRHGSWHPALHLRLGGEGPVAFRFQPL